jgi:hypothetical protein
MVLAVMGHGYQMPPHLHQVMYLQTAEVLHLLLQDLLQVLQQMGHVPHMTGTLASV